MFFANPWGLLGLLSLPVIVAVHLFQRRFPPLPVAGLHLWGVEAEVRESGRKRDRLPITATLLLELLASVLLTALLSQPRLGAAGTATHVVVVLDDSASMQAIFDGKSSFCDAAIAQLENRFADSESETVLTIILTGRRPTMLAGPAISWPEARRKLDAWRPRKPRHDFLTAWDLAAQFADNSGELLFLTDHLPEQSVPVPRRMEVVSVGSSVDNVAFTAARWSLSPVTSKTESLTLGYRGLVFLRVKNFGSRSVDAVVTGETPDKRRVFSRDLTLPADGEKSITAVVAGGVGEIRVTISAKRDGLALDSRVVLVEPSVRTLKVAVTLPENSSAWNQVNEVLRILPNVRRVAPELAHLIIGPAGTLPPSKEGLWWFGIGPMSSRPDAKKASKAVAKKVPFVIEKRHPLLDGVTLNGVKWAGVQPMNFQGTPLISAGSLRLLTQLAGTQTVAYLLNVDLAESTLTNSGDWPVLIQNLFDMRRRELPGLRRWNYRLGEDVSFRLPKKTNLSAPETQLTLNHGSRSRKLTKSRTIHLPPLDDVGVHEIRDGGKTIGRFTVNFLDQKESSLKDLASGRRAAEELHPPDAFRLDEPHSWLIVAGIAVIIAILLLNWRSLQPRDRRA